MKHPLKLIAVLILGLATGSLATLTFGQPEPPKSAFLIVSSEARMDADQEALAAYREAAGPLARQAGLQILASGEATLLEGAWPFGAITVEQFDSMAALKSFWYSDGYQQAKKLRAGQSTVHFIVAVEGN